MLTQCPECQKSVSSEAPNCPHCGFPIGEQKNIVAFTANVSDVKNKKTPRWMIVYSLLFLVVCGITTFVVYLHMETMKQQKEIAREAAAQSKLAREAAHQNESKQLVIAYNICKETIAWANDYASKAARPSSRDEAWHDYCEKQKRALDEALGPIAQSASTSNIVQKVGEFRVIVNSYAEMYFAVVYDRKANNPYDGEVFLNPYRQKIMKCSKELELLFKQFGADVSHIEFK